MAGAAGAIANAATRSALTGTSFGDNVMRALPDTIGSTIGNVIAGAVTGGGNLAGSRTVQGNQAGSTIVQSSSRGGKFGGLKDALAVRSIVPGLSLGADDMIQGLTTNYTPSGPSLGGIIADFYNFAQSTSNQLQSLLDQNVIVVTASKKQVAQAKADYWASILYAQSASYPLANQKARNRQAFVEYARQEQTPVRSPYLDQSALQQQHIANSFNARLRLMQKFSAAQDASSKTLSQLLPESYLTNQGRKALIASAAFDMVSRSPTAMITLGISSVYYGDLSRFGDRGLYGELGFSAVLAGGLATDGKDMGIFVGVATPGPVVNVTPTLAGQEAFGRNSHFSSGKKFGKPSAGVTFSVPFTKTEPVLLGGYPSQVPQPVYNNNFPDYSDRYWDISGD